MLHTTYITLGIDDKLLKLYYPYITAYFWLKTTIFWFLMTNYPISLLCRAGLVLILAKIGHFWRIFFLASESSQWTKLMLHTTYITLGIDNKLLKLYYPYITPYFWLKTTIFWFLMSNYPISLLCRAGLVMCNLTQRLYQIKYVARWRREWYLWTLCHCSAGAGFNHQSIFNMHISAQQSKVVIWYFLPTRSISVVKPIDSLLTNWGWNVPSSDQLKLFIYYLLLWLPTLLN